MFTDENAFETTLRLLAAARDEDPRAMDALFARHAPRVRRIVALRLGRPIRAFAELDDVVQETLLRAFKSFHEFEGQSVGAFRNWLSKCAVNTIRDLLRRRDAEKRGPDRQRCFAEVGDERLTSSILAGREPSPSEHAMGRELEERLEAALLELDERYREVIILRQLCDLSDEEIAAELGLKTTANVRTICHRALRKLEDKLARA